jgi:hypothetical protein
LTNIQFNSVAKNGMAEELDSQVSQLVDSEAPFLAFSEDRKKIVCTLNNHELPVRLEALKAFIGYDW